MSVKGHDRTYYRGLTDQQLLAAAEITMNVEMGIVLAERLHAEVDRWNNRNFANPITTKE